MQRPDMGTDESLPEKSGSCFLLGTSPIPSPFYSPHASRAAGVEDQSDFRVVVLAVSASALPAALRSTVRSLHRVIAAAGCARIKTFLTFMLCVPYKKFTIGAGTAHRSRHSRKGAGHCS